MEKKAQVSYYYGEDILRILKTDVVKDSIRMGDVILDFDNDKRIVGLEIMNATEFFEAFDLSREDLDNTESAKLSVNYSKDWAIIKISLSIPERENPMVKDFTIPSLEGQEMITTIT